jgi:hypothetical protein
MSPGAVGQNAAQGLAANKVYGKSKFWVVGRRVPEPNQDTQDLKEAFKYLPHHFGTLRVSWTGEEDDSLRSAVLHEVRVCPACP